MALRIEILGSAAGGGFPQWNCNCGNCRAVRAKTPGFLPRTQASIAVSADGERWLIVNASPDLRQQIAASAALSPAGDAPARSSPIHAVALSNADVDAIAGLLTLRERQPFELYASERVLTTLASNSVFNCLAPELVRRRAFALDQAVTIDAVGLTLEAFAVPGKIALYLEDETAPGFGSETGDTIGLKITDSATRRALFYIPGCARVDAGLGERLAGADLVLFDGTLWSEDEMLSQGLMRKTGSRMGHINMGGAAGSIAAFAALGVARKIFVHINNSNPVLDPASRERAIAESAGWTIGEDGMRFEL